MPHTLPHHPAYIHIPGLHLPRLARRIDSILLSRSAVLVFAPTAAEADAAAIDLADFHDGCRGAPVLPIHLVQGQRVIAQRPLPLPGAARPMACSRLTLPLLLDQVARFPEIPGLDPATWAAAPYRPVPGLLHAAAELYAAHGVARLALATSSPAALARTRAAIAAALPRSPDAPPTILFITGAPGAGKTLCGLDAAFDPARPAAFLTGNPALLHVLRAALARDSRLQGRAARQRIDAVIQPLHAFRDHHAATAAAPPDRLLVIDEAQRCWTQAYATRKTMNGATPLHASEPALILDAMARHGTGCAILCLLGGGQEIHGGEGGLAAWGEALQARPAWRAFAPPACLDHPDPRQRLPRLPGLTLDPALHLGTPIRAFRAPASVAWADAMLANRPSEARRLARTLPIRLTRSLPAMQAALAAHRGRAKIGLLASSGARRLRAEGLGALLWHQDEDAVARWFLDAWPDIRSADALEQAATEFGAQGLELDHTGLCWDLDLVRTPDDAWQARALRGTAWTTPTSPETLSNRLNAYRVLLTRARQSQLIWVPRGNPDDPTRDPARYDAIAAYLQSCGLRPLDESPATSNDAPEPTPALL